MCRTKLQRARSPCAGTLYHHVDVPRWPPEWEVGVFAPPFSRPALLGGRRGRRLSVVQGSYLLRSLSGFAPGSVSFSRDRVHSVPFHALHEKYFPCQADTLPYTAKRCGKLDCQAEAPCAFHLTVKLCRRVPFVKLRRPLAACFSISGAGMLPHPRPPPHVDKKFT